LTLWRDLVDSETYEFVDQRGNATKFYFFDITGEVMKSDISRNVVTEIETKFNAYTKKNDIESKTRHFVTTSVIIKTNTGSETDQTLNFDFPVRDTHKISIIYIAKLGEVRGYPIAAYNHSLNKTVFAPNPTYPAKSKGWGIISFFGGFAFLPFGDLGIVMLILAWIAGVFFYFTKPWIEKIAPKYVPDFINKVKDVERS
jgi:hypothetical protein